MLKCSHIPFYSNTYILKDTLMSFRWPVSLAPYSRVEIYVRHSSQIASVSEAWRFLMNTAEEIANSAGISPHEIILSMSLEKNNPPERAY